MEFFYITKDLSFTYNVNGQNNTISLPGIDQKLVDSKQIPASHVYVCTPSCLEVHANDINQHIKKNPGWDGKLGFYQDPTKSQIMSLAKFPVLLDNWDQKCGYRSGKELISTLKTTPFVPWQEKLKPLIDKGQKTIRIAIINGMATGLGDGIVGLRALNILYNQLSEKFEHVEIDLFQCSYKTDAASNQLYSQEMCVNSVRYLPLSLSQFMSYDAAVDFSAVVLRENFDTMPMIDFFLTSLGIAPDSVPPEQKRNVMRVNRKIAENTEIQWRMIKNNDLPVLLFHPRASTPLRSIPQKRIPFILKKIFENTNYHVVTITPLDVPETQLKQVLGKYMSRMTDLSKSSTTFDHLVNAVANVDAVITVDTCVYHITDAFDIPTIALFTSIDPELRAKYYPTVTATLINSKNNSIKGKHISNNDDDVKNAEKLWNSFDIVPLLNNWAVISQHAKTEECPVCASKSAGSRVVDRWKKYIIHKCSVCETEWSLPRIMENYDELYEQRYGHYLQEAGNPDETVAQYMQQLRFMPLKQIVETIPSDKVWLDVGCASGFLVRWLEQNRMKSWGIDISQAAVDFGSRHFQLKDRLAKVKIGEDMPNHFPKKFDVISSFELVEHLENPREFARWVKEMLNPGGYWIFSTPNLNRAQFKMGLKNTKSHQGLESGDLPAEHLQRMSFVGHQYLVNSFSDFSVVAQVASPLTTPVVLSTLPPLPTLQIEDTETKRLVHVPPDALHNVISHHMQPAIESLTGLGNFIITVVQRSRYDQ